MGNVYYEEQNVQKAIEYYQKALQIDPSNLPDVHYNIGNSYYMMQNNEDAIKHYELSLYQNPEKSECYYNLGNAYSNTEKYP